MNQKHWRETVRAIERKLGVRARIEGRGRGKNGHGVLVVTSRTSGEELLRTSVSSSPGNRDVAVLAAVRQVRHALAAASKESAK